MEYTFITFIQQLFFFTFAHVPFPLLPLCNYSHEDALDGWRQMFYPRQP